MMELDYEGLRAATTRFQYILPGQYNHSLIASEIVRAYIKSAQSESDSYGNGYKIGFNDGLVSARDTQSEPVKVKPLEWRKGYRDERVVITQASSSRLYQIRVLDGVVWLDWPDRREATTFSSEEAAQAAAQADYEQRIRSALVSHETPVGDSQTGSAGMGEGRAAKERWQAWAKKRLDTQKEYWMRAAKKALEGDLSELRNRVALFEAEPLELVLSEDTGGRDAG